MLHATFPTTHSRHNFGGVLINWFISAFEVLVEQHQWLRVRNVGNGSLFGFLWLGFGWFGGDRFGFGCCRSWFAIGIDVPVPQQLRNDGSIGCGGHTIGDNEHGVASFLNRCEYARHWAEKQHETGDGRQMASVAVAIVGPGLWHFTSNQNGNIERLQWPQYFQWCQAAHQHKANGAIDNGK